MDYILGKKYAEEIMELLWDSCDRIEIAGGIRRKKEEPHDIELVLQPTFLPTVDAFGNTDYENTANVLDYKIKDLLKSGTLSPGDPDKAGKKAPCGEKYYRLKYKNEKLDIFSVIDPAQWGTLFLIRTGDADFSHEFVLRLWKFGLKSVDGHIENAMGQTIDTPEEEDCFKLLKMPYIEPEQRTKQIFFAKIESVSK